MQYLPTSGRATRVSGFDPWITEQVESHRSPPETQKMCHIIPLPGQGNPKTSTVDQTGDTYPFYPM